ncbi:hypothetical protein J6590_026451 [Homalodisca vitripennis]|nr:hypothetical protein J6590_026451 [Homalodisca vitripennis]
MTLYQYASDWSDNRDRRAIRGDDGPGRRIYRSASRHVLECMDRLHVLTDKQLLEAPAPVLVYLEWLLSISSCRLLLTACNLLGRRVVEDI